VWVHSCGLLMKGKSVEVCLIRSVESPASVAHLGKGECGGGDAKAGDAPDQGAD